MCSEAYDRLVTEYWFAIYNALGTRVLYGLDLETHINLINQLCERTYTFKNKKCSIEKKDDMKARIGKSPDEADSFVYGVEVARRKGLVFEDIIQSTQVQREEIEFYHRIASGMAEEQEDDEIGYAGNSVDGDGF